MKVLSIAPVFPYDQVGHAGGKTYNYYVKRLAREPDVALSILCFSRKRDLRCCDLEKYGITHEIILSSGTLRANVEHLLLDKLSARCRKNSFFSEYKHRKILKYLKELEKQGKLPDVIQLEWTNFVLSAPDIRRRYPQIKLIASEHDVSFLGAQRRYIATEGKTRKKLEKQYLWLKEKELAALRCCDVVMPHNEKDKALLVAEGIAPKKIHVLTPYYHDMSSIVRENINHDILFWGAMYREENYGAALWFIDHVMPLLEDTDVRFVVAGNRPPQVLKDKESQRVIVTGFVEDETPYFANSLCFVAPLQLGAGIKVKVIEAMSCGIPILTNQIGIEGIPAKHGVNYFHCEQAEEYASVIRKLISSEIDCQRISAAQKILVDESFGLDLSFNNYLKMIQNLCEEG